MLKLGDYVVLRNQRDFDVGSVMPTEGYITSICEEDGNTWYRIAGESLGWGAQQLKRGLPEYLLALRVLGEEYFA